MSGVLQVNRVWDIRRSGDLGGVCDHCCTIIPENYFKHALISKKVVTLREGVFLLGAGSSDLEGVVFLIACFYLLVLVRKVS